MTDNLYLWLIPLLPLAGATLNGALGKRFPKPLVSLIALLFPGAAFAMALMVASRFSSLKLPYQEVHGAWIQFSGFTVNFAFMLDQLSLVMLLVVTGVGFLIHIYSVGYMSDDPGYYRFFAYLNLFMFFMLMLVLANNYLLMFVGWEGVGLASYLLIGFYFRKDSAAQAGKKAFITNRIGDFAFLLGMFLMVKYFGSLDYTIVLPFASQMNVETAQAGLCTLIAFCLLIGATGKSAQIPLYVWLPDAMEGPTPVSALIHAATMVTAGVYMTARSAAIFNNAPSAQLAVAVIGAVTAIFAATIGLTQFDIKRVLAYSTISQLGYMFLACGVGAYAAGVFHLMTHAFFKALLFLGAGSVIHAMSGEQDMRHMGGLRKYIPWTFYVMAAATLAISGFPGLAGFFSKDEILWNVWKFPHGGKILWVIGLVTAMMTAFYMFRLLFMTFFGDLRQEPASGHGHAHGGHGHDDHGHGHGAPHESPWIMLAPLVVLAVLSVAGGWVGIPHALGGHNNFGKFLEPVFERHTEVTSPVSGTVQHGDEPVKATHAASAEPAATGAEHDEVQMERILTGVSVLAAFFGIFMAWLFYVKQPGLPTRVTSGIRGLYTAVYNKYYVDEAYQMAIVDPIVDVSRSFLWRVMDVGIIDGAVNGAGSSAKFFSETFRKMQSGNIRSYAGWVALGAAGVLIYTFWMGMQ